MPVKQKLPYLSGIQLFAINSLFWMTASNEMKKSGVRGKSQTVGDGNYDLSSWWFYSPLSIHAFRHMGVGISFLCITSIPIGLAYIQSLNNMVVLAAIFIYFTMPITYSMAYVVGRYHAMAWFLFPISIASNFSNELEISALAFSIMALTSTTVWSISALFAITISIVERDLDILIPLSISSVFLLCYLIYVFWGSENLRAKILSILTGIGFLRLSASKNTKYARSDIGKLSYLDIWYIICSMFYVITGIYALNQYPYLIIISCSLLVLNSKCTRFADSQTLYFLIAITALIDAVRLFNDYRSLIVLLPFSCFSYLHKTGVINKFGYLRIIRPIDINYLIEDISKKLKSYKIKHSLYVPFKDPNFNYSMIFNGYRHSIEPIIYAGSSLGINVFPNWPLVFKGIDHEMRAKPWANDTSQILKNLKDWSTEYALVNIDIYEEDNELESSMSKVSKYTYDTRHFDAWSSQHFKNPNWMLYRLN